MIDNFEVVKAQLKELATVVNAFKSEAVQLRIVEIILSGSKFDSVVAEDENNDPPPKSKRRRKRSTKKSVPASSDSGGSKGTRKASGTGAIATLVKVYENGFFAKTRTINDILEHCETNLARKIKANEISGKLGRMVRVGELTRAKNADGQYEYKKA